MIVCHYIRSPSFQSLSCEDIPIKVKRKYKTCVLLKSELKLRIALPTQPLVKTSDINMATEIQDLCRTKDFSA